MNDPENVSFIRAQLTIANWYLDRAIQADGETSSRCLYHARQACDIVMRLLPNIPLDEDGRSLHRDLSMLRDRLRAAESGSGVDGSETDSSP